MESEIDVGLMEKFLQELPEKALHLGIRVVLAAAFLFVGLELVKLIRKLLKKSLSKAGADQGVIQFLDSLTKIGLTVLLILMIAVSFGLDAASVVAMLGSVGVAFALALQGSLSNCAGGVLILLTKPFKVGDYIIEGNKGQEGTVKEIQLFYTKLLTADGTVVTLPNGALANNHITNYSTMPERRLDLTVGISYDADVKTAKKALMELLQGEKNVLKSQPMDVFVEDLADSAVVLHVRCWVNNEDYWPERGRLPEKIKCALDQNGIGIPYPQMDVHVRNADS